MKTKATFWKRIFKRNQAKSAVETEVGTATQFQAEITIRKLIEELVSMNNDQEFSYSRDELVEMLTEEYETGDAFMRTVTAPRP